MLIEKEQEEQIINFGALGYDAKKIANILGVDPDTVSSEMSITDSKISVLLQKGKDMADYVIDLKLFEMAKSGDLKALDMLQKRKSFRGWL